MNQEISRTFPPPHCQADHIIGVFEGGGHCTLANMRTLCTACHREVTAAQAARRKKERAAIKAARKNGGDGGTKGNEEIKLRKKRKTKAEKEEEDRERVEARAARGRSREDGASAPSSLGLNRILTRARMLTEDIATRRMHRDRMEGNESRIDRDGQDILDATGA